MTEVRPIEGSGKLTSAVLLTSDAHLRGLDYARLTWVLNACDVYVPVIATPKEIVRKFFR